MTTSVSRRRVSKSMTIRIEGYGIVWGVLVHGFIPIRGCYSKAIAEHKAAGTSPRMLWGHDEDKELGRWLSFEEDEKGLRVKGALNPALPTCREILPLIRGGTITGLSIGNARQPSDFKVSVAAGRPDILVEHPLSEISPCSFPACPAARIDLVGV